jgi:hypothetical protein
MKRAIQTAAIALATILAMSGAVLARDDDDDRRGNWEQAQQQGYQNGYRDGLSQGRHEGHENDPYDYRTPDWHQATRGYQEWMGPVNAFQRGYQEGYSRGFQSGFESASHRRGDGDGDRDDRWHGLYGFNGGTYGRDFAYRTGYRDGSGVAREDLGRRKPYNPNPRGRFDDKDHGYRSEYGSKDAYKANYTIGYRAGYEGVMGNRY